ncbi:unnamed protein product [Mytilus edulis]|uniref:Integrase core domain-containing protein n=1 Tax=Mytilus edulis TaxID=6550 RepID=A0A8S3T6B3_MYTED|nr:unnamed protein product [Mytilus edulis]
MAQFGLSKQGFSEIDDGDLERVVSETIKDFPMCGEQMLRQLLRTKGLKIQRWRLRDCIHEIDSSGVRARKAGRLHRRTYNVMAPNHLWHIDTNHKLIRWRFVIIGGIDGFSYSLQLWGSGQVQNPVGMQMNETELPELGVGEQNNEATRDGERPIFQPLNLINEQCREILNNELNRTGENFGIDDYLKSLRSFRQIININKIIKITCDLK